MFMMKIAAEQEENGWKVIKAFTNILSAAGGDCEATKEKRKLALIAPMRLKKRF